MIVYNTTNLINGKIYVGKHKFNNDDYLGSGTILKLALEKYGKENFKREILIECGECEVNKYEVYFIEKYNSVNKSIGYNITKGGDGVDSKTAILLAEKRWKSKEQREQHSKMAKERWKSIEQREQHSKILKESCNDPKYLKQLRKRMKEQPTMKGKKHKESSKLKTSKKCKLMWSNDEMRNKILISRSKYYYIVGDETIYDYEFKEYCKNNENFKYSTITTYLRRNNYNIIYKGINIKRFDNE